MNNEQNIYRQSIVFDTVDEYGNVIEKMSYFYDQVVSYGSYKAPREPSFPEYSAAQSYVILRHKTQDNPFATRKFYTAHTIDELEVLFAEAEEQIQKRQPDQLQGISPIQFDFLRASIAVTVTDDPLAGKSKRIEHIFYDQITGHGVNTFCTQYHPVPFAKSYIFLENDSIFGKRQLYVTETEGELKSRFAEAEEELEAKAITFLAKLRAIQKLTL